MVLSDGQTIRDVSWEDVYQEMTPLREEIKGIVKHSSGDNRSMPDKWLNEDIDEIMKVIEKRLDSIIDIKEQDMKKPFKDRPIQTKHDILLLKAVKKEILLKK